MDIGGILLEQRPIRDSTVIPMRFFVVCSAQVSDSMCFLVWFAQAAEKKKKGVDVNHPGVVAASVEMQKVVHEFKKAHGKEKKVLKARVMQLQQQIVDDFKAVTNVGIRASTKFAREEAAEKHKK